MCQPTSKCQLIDLILIKIAPHKIEFRKFYCKQCRNQFFSLLLARFSHSSELKNTYNCSECACRLNCKRWMCAFDCFWFFPVLNMYACWRLCVCVCKCIDMPAWLPDSMSMYGYGNCMVRKTFQVSSMVGYGVVASILQPQTLCVCECWMVILPRQICALLPKRCRTRW